MMIWIDRAHRVVSYATGCAAKGIVPDGKTCFAVMELPQVSAGEELFFNPDTKQFYTRPRAMIDAKQAEDLRARAKARTEAEDAKRKALKWLAENDWKVNKHTLGEWKDTDPRWHAYLAERAEVRAAYDRALEALDAAMS